jgi:hypothetical protein
MISLARSKDARYTVRCYLVVGAACGSRWAISLTIKDGSWTTRHSEREPCTSHSGIPPDVAGYRKVHALERKHACVYLAYATVRLCTRTVLYTYRTFTARYVGSENRHYHWLSFDPRSYSE